MTVANITVKYVNQPRGEKKPGSIRLDTGEYISVWPDKLHLFEEGVSYRILYKEDKYGKTFLSMAGSDPQAPIDRPPSKPNGFTRPATTPQQVDIFITGTVQQWLNGAGQAGNPFPDAHQIEWMVRAAMEGWINAHKPKQTEINPPPPLDDEIPY